ncbi:hypothetical protein [Microvirga calopogonii]|uniref:hypothetical protein n=1 Tax=Microvirga calopogonii TaxID=2078013 RepID=UPI000E0D26A9|nr:hypothetical protein [Microvirga calopogonii]
MDFAMVTKPKDLEAARAQIALLQQNQQTLQAAQFAHRSALNAVAAKTPFGRDMIRHLNAGRSIEQAFGLAATHYAKIHAHEGLGRVCSSIAKFAKDLGLFIPRNKMENLARNVKTIVEREREAGRQLN